MKIDDEPVIGIIKNEKLNDWISGRVRRNDYLKEEIKKFIENLFRGRNISFGDLRVG